MRRSEAAVRYARALFEIAGSQNCLADMDLELETLAASLKKHPAILRLMLNSALTDQAKEDFLNRVLGHSASALLMNFLKVLLKKSRFFELASIQYEFRRFYAHKQGLQEVKVITAVPLSSENKNRLQALLEKQRGAKIRMHPLHDPGILGGVILRFDHQQMDGSYRSRLAMLRQQLLS